MIRGNRQLSGQKVTKVWHLFVVPFLCTFTNIITLKSIFKEKVVMGYEYVNEKFGKSVGAYKKMENSEYWAESYVKKIMPNYMPQYIKHGFHLLVQIFHCYNHQFTFIILFFIILFQYSLRRANPPCNMELIWWR